MEPEPPAGSPPGTDLPPRKTAKTYAEQLHYR